MSCRPFLALPLSHTVVGFLFLLTLFLLFLPSFLPHDNNKLFRYTKMWEKCARERIFHILALFVPSRAFQFTKCSGKSKGIVVNDILIDKLPPELLPYAMCILFTFTPELNGLWKWKVFPLTPIDTYTKCVWCEWSKHVELCAMHVYGMIILFWESNKVHFTNTISSSIF